MSDSHDEKLDAMLRARGVKAPSEDLAERIILQARGMPQAQNSSLWQVIRQLFAEFHLPKPGYVLASALILGMVVGFNIPSDGPAPQDGAAPTIQSVFSPEEALL